MSALKNARQERFAQELAKGTPAIQAHKLAGYSPDKGTASKLQHDPKVSQRVVELLAAEQALEAAALEKAIEKLSISKERVLEELAKLGFANIADYIDVSGETPTIRLTDVPRDKLAALSEITTETVFERSGSGKPTEVRRVKIKLWDKRGPLVDIGKHLGMFKERVEMSGPNGQPLPAERTVIILPANGRE